MNNDYQVQLGEQLMWKDSKGNYTADANVPELVKIREEMIRTLSTEAEELSKKMKEFKRKCFNTVDSYIELAAMQYGAKIRGTEGIGGRGNYELKSYDGSLKIQMRVGMNIEFDERLQIAKGLIDKCLIRWSEGANANLATLVRDAFKVDKKGKLDTARILQLRTYEIEDPEWKEAMEAISDSIRVQRARRYIRFFELNKDIDAMVPVQLDWAVM